MAIYKPSNCLPFLSCLDLTQPQNISCELNTSNETVTGYKIKILDSNNDVVFEGSKFDPISIGEYENSGVNGSIITLPLIVNGDPINHNTIGYDENNGFKAEDEVDFDSKKFSNDYANQPYKWEITFAQGQKNTEGILPNEYYDMVLDQGKILGSNRNRLQSVLSENITKDYFIQLNNREIRVPIKSYDYSFGYVYPKENVITDEEIEKAEYFEIYKHTNDSEVISAASQVLIKTNISMNSVKIDGKSNTVGWGTNLVYPNYFTQEFKGLNKKYESLPINAYDTGYSNDTPNEMGIGSVIMVAAEGGGSSAYNGIFNLQSIDNEEVVVSGSTTYTVTVKWLRNAASDTWATLTNKVYLVQHGSSENSRYQVNTEDGTGTGVINSSIVKFETEKPVELYTTTQYRDKEGGDNKTKAPIFKNTSEKAYIRPYSGPQKNVRLAYIKPDGTQFKYVDGDVESDGWYFKFKESEDEDEDEYKLTPDEVSYKILTFFNNSDENPFYAKISPTITIESKNLIKNESSSIIKYKYINRVLNVDGNITGRKWVNYKWVLTDLNMGYIQYTDVTYAGDIQATFYGLQNNHIYELSLTIEDEFGDVWVEQKLFEVVLNIVESESTFSATYECETQSVLLDFSEKGIIIPDPSIFKYENYFVKIEQDGGTEDKNYELYLVNEDESSIEASIEYCVSKGGAEKIIGYTISYDSNGLTLSDVSVTLSEDLIPSQLIEYKNQKAVLGDVLGEITPPSSDDITLNSQHILNSNFTGTVVSYKIDTKDVNTLNSYLELNVVVPPVQNYSQEDKKYVANNDRNVLFLQVIKSVNGNEVWNSNEEISLYELVDDNWKSVETNRWQTNKQIAFLLVDPKATINENVDYIKTTNSYVYENERQSETTNQNIFESYNSGEGLMGWPLLDKAEKQGDDHLNVWSNKKLAFIQQTSFGDKINVITNEFNKWTIKDETTGNYCYWHIYGNGGTPTRFVETNHNGRQNINKYKFTFNIVIKDYNSKTVNKSFISNNIKAKVFKEIV